MVISVHFRLFRFFGSYSGISVIPVTLVNRRTGPNVKNKYILSLTSVISLFVFFPSQT